MFPVRISILMILCLQVGLLDIDLCGPSIPYLLDIEGAEVHQSPEGWLPVFVDEEKRLGVMSIGFLLKNKNDSVVWRGPKKSGTFIRRIITRAGNNCDIRFSHN